MPKKGGRRKKRRTHVVEDIADEKIPVPKTFVFKIGKTPSVIPFLVQDMRRVMAPYTADKLRENRKNTLKDFIHVGAPLGVTHFLFFSSTEHHTNMKIARLPRGPTLSFQVEKFSLMRHIHCLHKRPLDVTAALHCKPLVVLNNFSSNEDHIKLMNVTFQSIFPPIEIQTVRLSECRRVVLFNYDKEADRVEFRHYVIRANPLGLSKPVKTIIRAKIPDLSKLNDISDYVLGNGGCGGITSDSEVDDEQTHVTLTDKFCGRGNERNMKSAVRLVEIGPRLSMKLTKVEREVSEGDVLYHAYVSKPPEEAAKAKAKREKALRLKKKRREEQEINVARKLEAKEMKKRERQERIQQKQAQPDQDEADDAEYYRNEVGEELPVVDKAAAPRLQAKVAISIDTKSPKTIPDNSNVVHSKRALPKGKVFRPRKRHVTTIDPQKH